MSEESETHEKVIEKLEELEIRTLDLYKPFLEDFSDSREHHSRRGRGYGHYNEKGYKYISDKVRETLNSLEQSKN